MDTVPRYGDSDNDLLFKITKVISDGGAAGSVNSFNGRTGAVTLQLTDITSLAVDSRYVLKAGSTMTGALVVGAAVTLRPTGDTEFGAGTIIFSDGGYAQFGGGIVAFSDLGAAEFGSGGATFDATGNLVFAGSGVLGLTVNSLTTAQRNALTPAAGSVIWNSTVGAFNGYTGTAWVSLSDADTTLAYAATVDLDFVGTTFRTVTLAGNITFTTSNRAATRSLTLRIIGDGSQRTLTFPAGWKFFGAAAPANLAANKEAMLTITAFGANDTDVRAAYSAEP